MSADAERARLEAIVYGRPGAASEAEIAAAKVELQDLIDQETPAGPGPQARPTEESATGPRPLRRWPLVVVAAAVIAVLVLIGSQLPHASLVPRADGLEVFETDQQQDDLLALDRLGDLAESSRPTVRWLGSSNGLGIAAYLLTGGVCLGVFETVPDEVGAPAAKGCVTVSDFGLNRLTVLYPSDAPRFSVTWGASHLTVQALD